jgi:hypothetical protein
MVTYKIINNLGINPDYGRPMELLIGIKEGFGKIKETAGASDILIVRDDRQIESNEPYKCLIKYDSCDDFIINGKTIMVSHRHINGNSLKIKDNINRIVAHIKYTLGLSRQKIILASYASRQFAGRLEKFRVEAERSGYFNDVMMYSENDIASAFKKRHADVWGQSRGGGYWIWKPYIILKSLREALDNDIVCYIDGGCKLCCTDAARARFGEYIGMVNNNWQGVLRMQLAHKESKYTNQRLFDFCREYFEDERESATALKESMQLVGGIMIIRKTPFAMKFFEKVMDILEKDDKLITDFYNRPGEEHRHDQSLLSLVYKYMGGSLIIEDETYFPSGRFDDNYAAKFPIWATRLRA